MTRYFTAEGLRKVRKEIDDLERFIKIDVARDLHAAAAHGDLRENGEYAAAKERQTLSMARLKDLRERVRNAQVVTRREFPEDVVTLLKRVKIKDVASGRLEEYTILGDDDIDLDNGVISYGSPLAASLIGHKRGEVVEMTLPAGKRKIEILDIAFFEEQSGTA